MKNLFLYHADCNDGKAAALAAWLIHRDSDNRYMPVRYEDPPPWYAHSNDTLTTDDLTGCTVYILDFSYPIEVLEDLATHAERVFLIDHHITAARALSGSVPANVQITFDIDKAGCVLAWEQFHPHIEPPPLYLYVQDRDLWTKKNPHSDAIYYGLTVHNDDWRAWEPLIGRYGSQRLNDVRVIGNGILKYVKTQIASIIEANTDRKNGAIVTRRFGAHDVPIINAPHYMASDLGNSILTANPSLPFTVSYIDSLANNKRIYSLRSTDRGIDVSAIAKAKGGGGHRNAAGFSAPLRADHLNRDLITNKPTEDPIDQAK